MSTPEERAAACAKKKHYQQEGNATAAANRMEAMHPGTVRRVTYKCDCGQWCLTTPIDINTRRKKGTRGGGNATPAPPHKKGRWVQNRKYR